MADFFDITWGRIRLLCSTVSTEGGRTLVVHELSNATRPEDHPVDDRGPVPRKVTCQLLFIDQPNEPATPADRLEAFIVQVDRGGPELFTHPVIGSYLAHVENFTYDIDEDSNISNASCVLVPAGEIQDLYPAQFGSAAATGLDSVGARADVLADTLADFEIESTIPADAIATSESWVEGPDVPIRDVLVDIAQTSAALDALIEDEELDSDLALWPAYQATILLHASYRQAAIAATSETPSIFFMLIGAPTSILALVTRIYGGAESTDRERQFRALNDVRSPGGLLEAGTYVALPGRSSSRQAF